MLYHPDGNIEIFPHEAQLMLPLGAALPPAIHIGYAPLLPGNILLLATTSVAKAQARSHWAQALGATPPQQSVAQIAETMRFSQISGSALIVYCLEEPLAAPEPARKLWPPFLLSRTSRPTAPPARSHPDHAHPRPETPAAEAGPAAERPAAAPQPAAPADEIPTPGWLATVLAPLRRQPTTEADTAITPEETTPEAPAVAPEPAGKPAGKPLWTAIRLPQLTLPTINLARFDPRRLFRRRAAPGAHPAWQMPRFSLKPLFQALLPGKVETGKARAPRPVPAEKTTVMGGLALGVLLTVAFITLSTYLQFGGAQRAAALVVEAQALWGAAYSTQSAQDWQKVRSIAERILTLDPQNSQAQALREDAQLAIDALENAAVLSATAIMELGTSPTPRQVLVADSWVYILNTATDQVFGLPLSPDDGITPPTAAAPTSILQRGQALFGEAVGQLVALAWMKPSTGYPDGAIVIYSDDGSIYIYEPTLGPAGITRKRLDYAPYQGAVTIFSI